MNAEKNSISLLIYKAIKSLNKEASLIDIGLLDDGVAYLDVSKATVSANDLEKYEEMVRGFIKDGFSKEDLGNKDVEVLDSDSLSVAFKIFSTSGAYIDGDESKEMITRIRTFVFKTQKELDEFLKNKSEESEFDHRNLN